MKKRRTLIVTLLLVAALALGIGYAALTDTLRVGGTAGVSAEAGSEAFEADVYFSKAISGDKADASVGADNDTATMTVKADALKVVGDEAVATFTIKSDSDLAVVITNPTVANGYITNDNKEYFEVTTNWVADHTLTPNATNTATVDITVTVKLIKTPSVAQDVEFGIQLNVKSDG